jgi:hypothetical protein
METKHQQPRKNEAASNKGWDHASLADFFSTDSLQSSSYLE